MRTPRRPFVILAALSVVGVVVIAAVTAYQTRALAEAAALQHAKLYAQALAEFQTLYTR